MHPFPLGGHINFKWHPNTEPTGPGHYSLQYMYRPSPIINRTQLMWPLYLLLKRAHFFPYHPLLCFILLFSTKSWIFCLPKCVFHWIDIYLVNWATILLILGNWYTRGFCLFGPERDYNIPQTHQFHSRLPKIWFQQCETQLNRIRVDNPTWIPIETPNSCTEPLSLLVVITIIIYYFTLSRVGSKVPFPVPHFITHNNNNNWSLAIPYDRHKLISLSLTVCLCLSCLSVCPVQKESLLSCVLFIIIVIFIIISLLYSSHPIPPGTGFLLPIRILQNRFCCSATFCFVDE